MLNAYLGWAILCFVFGLVGGFLYIMMGYGTDLEAFVTATSVNFYFTQISALIFYSVFLLAMRRVLRKRRGRGSFSGYFSPIGGRRLLYAALSGLVWSGVVIVLLLSIVLLTMHWQYHPATARAIAHSWSIGRLTMLGLIVIVLAPLSEEMFFRGLLLECSSETGLFALGRDQRGDLCALAFTLPTIPGDHRLEHHRCDRRTGASLCTVGPAHSLTTGPGHSARHLQCHAHARCLLLPLT